MSANKEYCLVLEGNYLDESEAENALREPFIEEYVENAGKFRIHNFDDIEIAGGFSIGDITIEMVDDMLFEVKSNKSGKLFNEHKAKLIAEALRIHDMFEDIRIEPVN